MTASTNFDDPIFLKAMAVLRGNTHQTESLPQSPIGSNTPLPNRLSAALHCMQSIAEEHLTKLRDKVLKHAPHLAISQVPVKLVAHVKTSVSRSRQTRTQRHTTRSATSSGSSSDGSDAPPAPIQCHPHLCYPIALPCCTVKEVTPTFSDTSPPHQSAVPLHLSATEFNWKYTFQLIVSIAITINQIHQLHLLAEALCKVSLSPPDFHYSIQIGTDFSCHSSSMGATHE